MSAREDQMQQQVEEYNVSSINRRLTILVALLCSAPSGSQNHS